MARNHKFGHNWRTKDRKDDALYRAEVAEAESARLASVVAKAEALGDEWTAEADRLQEFADRHQGYYQGIVGARRTCRDDLRAVLADATPDTATPGEATIADMARRFSLWLNSTYPADLCEEAVHWRRITKISEEAGEVRDALGAYFHENPRKPAGSIEKVIEELADCVGAALGAIEHLTGHEGRSLDIATERVRFVCERVGVRPALASVAPDTATPGEARHQHAWVRKQNVTSRGYELPPYEVCRHCGSARSADDKVGEW